MKIWRVKYEKHGGERKEMKKKRRMLSPNRRLVNYTRCLEREGLPRQFQKHKARSSFVAISCRTRHPFLFLNYILYLLKYKLSLSQLHYNYKINMKRQKKKKKTLGRQ